MATELVLGLGLGLGAGMALCYWQRLQFNNSLNTLLERPLIAMPDRSGSPLSLLASGMAHQQQRSQQLETDKQALNQALNLAPVGYLQVDKDNHLLFCNPKVCQILDIHNWHPSTRLLLEVVRSFEVDQLIEEARRSQRQCEQTWSFQGVSDDLDQAIQQPTRLLRGTSIPLPNQQIGVYIEDRQEVMLLTQQRDRWASDVAHELRTPLTSIRLITETLQSRIDPKQRHWLDRLLKEVVRLSSLVQDLLDLGVLKAGETRVSHHGQINLAQLIQTAWSSLEPLAIQKQVTLAFTGSTTLMLRGDENRLLRLVLNLLDNSIKFSPPESVVQVKLSTYAYLDANLPDWLEQPERADNWIYLEVFDAGCGFSDQDLPYVFDRFYRADTSRSRSNYATPPPQTSDTSVPALSLSPESGSGLGLAIARQIVAAHKGMIRASNHPITHGAWLQVLLPWEQ